MLRVSAPERRLDEGVGDGMNLRRGAGQLAAFGL
jgi:hypothetical protein